MPLFQPNSRQRKFLRVTLITAGVFILIGVGLHIWFVNNARGILKSMVAEKSKGKFRMELSEISFDFFSNKIKIREADLVNTDSTSSPTTYHVKFRKLTLRVGSFWGLLFKRQLLLDSIKLHDPLIEVTQWREDTTIKRGKGDLSISQEMGKLYNSMLDALEDFGIRRIIINNAAVTLVNKMNKGSEPVRISDIYFDLVRTARDVRKRDEFVENEQSIELRTREQNIALPGGRHTLAFKNFHLELFQKRIQLDSCTITAIATDSSRSSYSVFFKKLLLIGVDFTAMYRNNLIRADSVYCESPLFNINLKTGSASNRKAEKPDPDKIIQDLTGDLDLAFIGVKDAGIHINILGTKERSLFNSNKDDFEMRGLKVNADSSKRVVVQRFDMLVQDYRLYNEDSSAAYTFDSIHFQNNKITLTNFKVATELRSGTHNYRDFSIPHFALTGLDWYSLIFDQNLVAREAVLYSPVINFVSAGNVRKGKKRNLFASLATLDELVALNKIQIINGQLNMKLNPTTAVDLKNVDLNIYSDRLLSSTNKEGLKQAVEGLSFSNGTIRLKDLTARLKNVRYTGTNLMEADQLNVTAKGKEVTASLNNVKINDLLLDDDAESVSLKGLEWTSANIDIHQTGNKAKTKKSSSFLLEGLRGTNTRFRFSNGNTVASTFIDKLQVGTLTKSGLAAAQINGLFIAGKALRVQSGPMVANATSYTIQKDALSTIQGFRMQRIQNDDSLYIQSPSVRFVSDINSFLAKGAHISEVAISSPIITMAKTAQPTRTASKPGMALRIDRMQASEPIVNITNRKVDSSTFIRLPYSPGSRVAASGIIINGSDLQVASLDLVTSSATFVKKTGEVVGVENGTVAADVSDIRLSKVNGVPQWAATINSLDLQNPNNISFGKRKNRLSLKSAAVGNVRLSSEYVSNLDKLLKFNVSAWLRTATGEYSDSTTTLKWYNTAYNSATKTLSLDSFTYYPTQPRDSVVAKSPYQTDYLTFSSGAINLTGFNLERYERDSAIIANTLTITNPLITTYRDKQPPFLAGIIKPLPTALIQKLSLALNINTIRLVDGKLAYTEKHAKTRAEGTLELNHLNATISNIQNRNLQSKDSLELMMNAFLMDSAELNLSVRQSYADTLGGFVMNLRMKPTSLSFLNPVLAPLSNVIITSGTIDSFSMRAVGSEYLSLGEMKMYYHDLKIKLVQDGNPDETSVSRRVVSFLANALLIHKRNNGRTGVVYFERLRDRSFFNYLVKMAFSGMASSIGVKSNKKSLKKYRKQLELRNLPPVNFQ